MSATKKRLVLAAASGLVVVSALFHFATRAPAEPVPITAYVTRECECCGRWAAHMKENGFLVTTRYISVEQLARLKDRYGVPPAARSCHVAEVRGYVVEGHTPADVVRRLLGERPALAGVAVPGMPVGSPGMEVPGRRPQAYHVVGFDGDGSLTLVERR